mmetsp:Transcript_29874/g.79194  ORF Transcript_29874/g.79194 Transcript_29874/m.79194 type:complete len:136 (-) Transcript_29874:125-532(-)
MARKPDEDEDPEDPDDEAGEEFIELAGEAGREAKQLDGLTDHHGDDEDDSKVDTKEVEARLNDLRKKKEKSDLENAEREKQLAAVRINKEDLDLMCDQLPLCEREAVERVLRENGGDLAKAIRAAVKTFPRSACP